MYVDTLLDVRLERIKKRPPKFDEDRARKVSRADLEVFDARERVVQRLMAAEPERFLTIVNDRPLPEGVAQILGLVHARRSGVS